VVADPEQGRAVFDEARRRRGGTEAREFVNALRRQDTRKSISETTIWVGRSQAKTTWGGVALETAGGHEPAELVELG